MSEANDATPDMSEPLTARAVERGLAKLPGWTLDQGELRKEFEHPSADAAAKFAGLVARRSAKFNHPIALSLTGSNVKVLLPPVGEKLARVDFVFARRLDPTKKEAAAEPSAD